MKKMNKLKLGLTALMICGSATALANDSFSWGGYMKTGGGYNANLLNLTNYETTQVGRLGNEYDTWLASTFRKSWTGENGEWAKYTLEMTYFSDHPDRRWNNFNAEKNFVEIGGLEFLPEGSNIWMGTVEKNQDIFIMDTKWQELAGTGVGLETKNYDFGILSSTANWMAINGNNVEATTLTGRVSFGAASVRVNYTKVAEFDDLEDTMGDTNNTDGAVDATLVYDMNSYYGLTDGSAKLIVQAGTGKTATQLGRTLLSTDEEDKSMRIIADGSFYPAEGLIVDPVAMFTTTNYNADGKEAETALTAAARISQKINKNWGMLYEGVVYNVQNSGGTDGLDGTKYKIAAGPTLKLSTGNGNYWARPEMRFTAAYISGDEDIVTLTEGDSSEFRFGYQIETWF